MVEGGWGVGIKVRKALGVFLLQALLKDCVEICSLQSLLSPPRQFLIMLESLECFDSRPLDFFDHFNFPL